MRIASASENLDVVPTVLDYLGIEVKAATSARFEGRSLRSSIEGAEDGEQMAFSSWRAKRSVVRGHYKLVYDLSSEKHELYDVSVDPFQRVDLSHEQSDVAATLLKALKARFTRLEGNRQRSIEAGDAAIEQLKALGYLE
jgi:arylsulfatase A-like enzyme